MILFALATAMAADGCDGIEPASQVIDRVEAAFRDLDAASLSRNTVQLTRSLSCEGKPVSPALAARAHQAYALSAYVDGDTPRFAGHLCAARHAVRDFKLNTDIVPEGSPLRTTADSLQCEQVAEMQLTVPIGDGIWVDGHANAPFPVSPAARPFFFQHVRDGKALRSAMVPLGGAPPALAPPVPAKEKKTKRKTAGWLLTGFGTAFLATGAIFTARGASWNKQINDAQFPLTGAQYKMQADAQLYGGIAALAVGAGLTTAGIVTLVPKRDGVEVAVMTRF